MKNIVIIDIDTERADNPLIIAKPNKENLPKSREEAKITVLDDIKTLTEGLASLIRHSNANGYASKDILIDAIVKHINLTAEKK